MINRNQLEYDIIGACIIENSFHKVNGLLKARNFNQPECQVIYTKLAQLWPNYSINLHAISRKLTHEPKLTYNWQYYIASITQHTLGSSALVDNAFILLELDFKDKFLGILNTYRLADADLPKKVILDEILAEANHPTADVFITMDIAQRYLKANGLEAISDEILELSSQINLRAQQIRLDNRKEQVQKELDKITLQEEELNKLIKLNDQQAA